MELRHLKHFLTVAELKHFHQAALQLNLAQPSLSRSIQKMEELLGVKLLERTSRSVSLTPFGDIVVQHGSNIVRDVELMKREIQSLQGLETGELIIGASAIPLNSLVGPVVGKFVNAYPTVSVELKVGNWKELYQQLKDGKLSLFVAETKATELDKREDINMLPLPAFAAVFCCGLDHPLSSKQKLQLEDLALYPLAIPTGLPSSISQQFKGLFSKERSNFSGLIKFDQFQSIRDAIKSSQIIALVPVCTISQEIEDGTMQILPLIDMPDIRASYSIVTHRSRKLSPATRAFVEFLL